jgi:NAD(P)-dependent dehydrogenase (short-subunit alcohol dehydrogenase family)
MHVCTLLPYDFSVLLSLSAEHGVSAKYIHTDVSKEDDVKAMVDFVKDNFGRLDYAFDNAGILTCPIPVRIRLNMVRSA